MFLFFLFSSFHSLLRVIFRYLHRIKNDTLSVWVYWPHFMWRQWIIPHVLHGPCWGYCLNHYSQGAKWKLLLLNHTPCGYYYYFFYNFYNRCYSSYYICALLISFIKIVRYKIESGSHEVQNISKISKSQNYCMSSPEFQVQIVCQVPNTTSH